MDKREKALAAQREYMRRYREKNRERINAKTREWNRKNPEKHAEYRRKFFEKLAEEYEREGIL